MTQAERKAVVKSADMVNIFLNYHILIYIRLKKNNKMQLIVQTKL